MAVLVVLFTVLALGSAISRAPWCDEAYFSEPAYRLATVGEMSTAVVPPSPFDDPKTLGTDHYTFYTMPLDLVLQAGWYRVAGFGYVQMRVLALLWGVAGIAGWWLILAAMGADRRLRVVGTAMVALDYAFVRAGSDGRMDMMSAALSTLGLATFLVLQKRHYGRAVIAGASFVAASAFTHPIGGLIGTAALGIAMLWYSEGRFRWWHALAAAGPYLCFAAAWGLYILRAPDIFRAQFFAVSAGRLTAWKQPLQAVVREVGMRWSGPYGLTPGAGMKRVRALALLIYVCGIGASVLGFGSLRRRGLGLLPVITGAALAILLLFEGTKSAAYLVHVVPYLAALAACWITRFWKPMGRLAFALLMLVQVAGSVYVITRREYSREYAPAIAFLKKQGGDVTGVASLGFGLGFGPGLTDDRRLGYFTRRDTRFIVVDGTYQGAFDAYRDQQPEFYDFIEKRLAARRPVFENALFKIYEK